MNLVAVAVDVNPWMVLASGGALICAGITYRIVAGGPVKQQAVDVERARSWAKGIDAAMFITKFAIQTFGGERGRAALAESEKKPRAPEVTA